MCTLPPGARQMEVRGQRLHTSQARNRVCVTCWGILPVFQHIAEGTGRHADHCFLLLPLTSRGENSGRHQGRLPLRSYSSGCRVILERNNTGNLFLSPATGSVPLDGISIRRWKLWVTLAWEAKQGQRGVLRKKMSVWGSPCSKSKGIIAGVGAGYQVIYWGVCKLRISSPVRKDGYFNRDLDHKSAVSIWLRFLWSDLRPSSTGYKHSNFTPRDMTSTKWGLEDRWFNIEEWKVLVF